MRPIFISDIAESKTQPGLKDRKEQIERATDNLSGYLINDYWPKTLSYSKHALMGPVGKLLAVLVSGRIQGKEALVGYVANIHQNTSQRERISPEGLKFLNDAIDALVTLREGLPKREWLRVLRDLDYAVFFKKYEQIAERIEEKRKRVQNIRAFLEAQYGTIEALKAAIPALGEVEDLYAASGKIDEQREILPGEKQVALTEHLKAEDARKEG